MSPLVATRAEPSAPKKYQFSAEDQHRYGAGRFWRMPRASLSELAALSPTELVTLAAIAVHVWPSDNDASGFTRWWEIAIRRLAALTGFDKNTVSKALRSLERAGWIEYAGNLAVAAHKPGRVRVSSRAYTLRGQGGFVIVPATLFYGGWMRVLPTPSAKKLLIVGLGLVHVQNRTAYLDGSDRHKDEYTDEVQALSPRDRRYWMDDDELFESAASAGARSLTAIAEIAQLGATTRRDAWYRVIAQEKRTLPFPFPPLLEGRDHAGAVYLIRNDEALAYQFPPDALNDPASVAWIRSHLRKPRREELLTEEALASA